VVSVRGFIVAIARLPFDFARAVAEGVALGWKLTHPCVSEVAA
jgi:hypothetical protein